MSNTAIHIQTDAIRPSLDGERVVRRAWFSVDVRIVGLTTDRTVVDAQGRQIALLDSDWRAVCDSISVVDAIHAIRSRSSTFRIRNILKKQFVADGDGRILEFDTERAAHAAIDDLTDPDGRDLGLYHVVDVKSGLVTWSYDDGDEYVSAFAYDWDIEKPDRDFAPAAVPSVKLDPELASAPASPAPRAIDARIRSLTSALRQLCNVAPENLEDDGWQHGVWMFAEQVLAAEGFKDALSKRSTRFVRHSTLRIVETEDAA